MLHAGFDQIYLRKKASLSLYINITILSKLLSVQVGAAKMELVSQDLSVAILLIRIPQASHQPGEEDQLEEAGKP